MADNKKVENSKIDALYQWISYDLQKIREDLMGELKISSAQIGYLYKGIKGDKDTSSAALENEIRYSYKQNQNIYEGLANLLKTEVAERITSIDEQLSALEQLQAILSEISDLKYSCGQLQALYEGLSVILSGDVAPKLDAIVSKEEMKELVDESAAVHTQTLSEAIAAIPAPEAVDYARISEEVSDKILELLNALKANEEANAVETESVTADVDYERIAGDTAAKVLESLPYPDQFDYHRIDESMNTALSGALNVDALSSAIAEKIESPELEEIADVVAAKVVVPQVEEIAQAVEEKMPVVDIDAIAEAVKEKIVIPTVDNEAIAQAVSAKIPAIDVDAIVAAVSEKILPVDMDALAVAVAAKMFTPDVDAIAEAVVAKMVAPSVDYDKLADTVLDKLTERGMSADVILDDEGIEKIANTVAGKVTPSNDVDYERVAAIVDEKLANSCTEFEKVVTLDDEGVAKIVDGVAEELRNMTLVCEYLEEENATEEVSVEEAVEEGVEETVETPVEETVEETVEEVAETPVEEVPVEETAAEEPAPVPAAEDELAVSALPVFEEDMDGQLIDAETGLVIRLKRSFTAKMKQSEEKVKVYYSDIKNALTSYKRINSNVSWHGDRFNFGRDTVAKMGINGKTLCFYLALDPNDPELKTTVYHQKDVGSQRAYESTPFLVKVKSDAAAKKALRLVSILAEKLGAIADEAFKEVDYVAEFAYASTKTLFESGDIKATKEKKVDFDF